jgi:glycosyltransferase involved in cell wall biosynthesis
LLPRTAVNPKDYDLAILHFDENVLRPDACLGKVPLDWGRAFQQALEWELPKVAICHGTPQFRGQYDATYNEPDLGEIDEESRLELVERLKDVMVVCNSHQARQEWQFRQSVTIWHGFSPHEFPPNMFGAGAFTMGQNALENRPHYNGLFTIQAVKERLGGAINIASLEVPDPPPTYAPRTAEWAQVKYQNYIREIGKYAIYINPTVRSPMPRTRGESMMAGLVTVSLRNHDVDMFIENGVNGFVADTADQMAEHIRFLMNNPVTCRKIGLASRQTALEMFNQNRFLSDWTLLVERVLGQRVETT